MEYTLDLTKEGYQKQHSHDHSYYGDQHSYHQSKSGYGSVPCSAGWIKPAVPVVLYIIYWLPVQTILAIKYWYHYQANQRSCIWYCLIYLKLLCNDECYELTCFIFRKKSASWGGDLITLAIVGIIIYAIYKTCLSTSHQDPDSQRGDRWGSERRSQPPPPGFRQDYMPRGKNTKSWSFSTLSEDWNFVSCNVSQFDLHCSIWWSMKRL